VARVAAEVSDAHDDGVVLVAVLKGSIPFLADMARALAVVPVFDFMAISPYAPHSGRVRIVKDLDMDITGRDVVVVEDIVDTGLTLHYLLAELGRRGPRSIEACALFDRTTQRIIPVPVRYAAFEIGDEFLLGYGLDFAERYRNLDKVVVGDRGVLRDDPDAYVSALYSG